MSEFKCMHCMAKVDYVDVWGQQGDDWIEGDCPLTEEQCKNNWCDWHGCAAEFIQEDTNLDTKFWKQELKDAELTKKDVLEPTGEEYFICKSCYKEREEAREEMEIR